MAVLIQSLTVMDACARAAADGRGVSMTSAIEAPDNAPAALKVDRMDKGIDTIVPANATIERVATGFTWVEGPIWIPAGYLLFAEITSNSIRKLTVDGHAHRDVWRLESLNPKGQVTVLADSFEGKKLNSPNDLVYKSDGALYFTDPPYGLPTQGDSDPIKELQVNGVYRIPKAFDQKPGTAPARDQLQLLVKDLPRPNGIAFSPDEKYLYVDNSQPKKLWMRYRVKEDGTLTDAKVFYDATSDSRPGGPDGMKVDRKGNVYSTGPGGVWI